MIRVLIADDEPIIRRTIRLVGNWEEYGMEVVGEAKNGVEVKNIIKDGGIDLVILDMNMPGMSGGDVLQYIKDHHLETHIIVVSGYSDFSYAQLAVKCGADDYILKPVDRKEFQLALEKISHRIYNNSPDLDKEPNKTVVDIIKERIDKDYREDLSLESLAVEYYVNKDALSRAFKKTYGIGFSSYLNNVRLEQAKAYLLLGYSITETAIMVGYNDVNYFSRIFKKTEGISPTDYKKHVGE